MHLHGHSFSVVRSAGSSTYNYKNPVRRDVVSSGGLVPGVDNTTIRFTTDNTGPWFLHCHIDWHLAAGMAVVFAEDQPDTARYDQPSSQWENLCPSYNSYEGSS
jgi:iron transport multicopper oxidase